MAYDFMRILESMPDDFEMVEMGVDDIVVQVWFATISL